MPNRIKFTGMGWVCDTCWWTGGKNQVQEKREEYLKMMNVTINITASPELLGVLHSLATAVSGVKLNQVETAPVQQAPAQQQTQQAPVQQAPVQQAPVQPPVQQPPMQQSTQQPTQTPDPLVSSVPTTAPTYAMEQLAVAATQLVDAGRRGELLQLLGSFGVQALTALPKEQYGNFATALRQMGAKI